MRRRSWLASALRTRCDRPRQKGSARHGTDMGIAAAAAMLSCAVFKTVVILLVAIQVALPRLPLAAPAGGVCPPSAPAVQAPQATQAVLASCDACCCAPAACPCMGQAPEAPPRPEPAPPPAPRLEFPV